MSYQIRYVLDPHTLNYVAYLLGTPQNLVISRPAFARITGTTGRAVLGEYEATVAEAREIGFIILDEKGANANECLHPASVSA